MYFYLHLILVIKWISHCLCAVMWRVFTCSCFLFIILVIWKVKMKNDKSSLETRGSLRNTQTMTRAQRHLLFFLSFSYSPHFLNRPPHHPAARCFPILKFPQSFRCSQFHNAQMLSFGPLPPSNLELSFITFLWSWEWKRWDKGERGGAESNMAAYLEDFLYWNMCKQFTHKGLK